VQALVASGANVNAVRSDGLTALLWAAQRGTYALVAPLVAAGADVEERTSAGHTALLLAASAAVQGHVAGRTVAALLAAGAAVDAADNAGHTALLLAAQAGRASLVPLLASAGADLERRAGAQGGGPTALLAAIGTKTSAGGGGGGDSVPDPGDRKRATVTALIAAGSDANATLREVRAVWSPIAREQLSTATCHFNSAPQADLLISARLCTRR